MCLVVTRVTPVGPELAGGWREGGRCGVGCDAKATPSVWRPMSAWERLCPSARPVLGGKCGFLRANLAFQAISRPLMSQVGGVMPRCSSLVCCLLSCSVVFDSLQPHGLELTRLLCPWGLSRQEHWSGFPCPPPGDLSNPGTEPRSPTLQTVSLPSEPQGSPS